MTSTCYSFLFQSPARYYRKILKLISFDQTKLFLRVLDPYTMFRHIKNAFVWKEIYIILKKKNRIPLKMAKEHLFLILCVAGLLQIHSQMIAITNNTRIEISTLKQLAQYNQSNQGGLLTCVAFTPTSIWTMTSNNSIKVIDKADLSVVFDQSVEYSLDFNFVNTEPLSMIVFDRDYTTMAVTGIYNNTLLYYFYRFTSTTLPTFEYSLSFENQTSAPSISFLTNFAIYSFFSYSNKNDTIFIVNLENNTTSTIKLSTSNSSLVVSPNKEVALVWTPNSQVYIYSIASANFRLLHIFNDSLSTKKGTTNSISFSSDSTLAIIETDKRNQIRILNLNTFQVVRDITYKEDNVVSVFFLDVDNRFILINRQSKAYLYDMTLSSLTEFSSELSADYIIVDQIGGKFITGTSQNQRIMGITISSLSNNSLSNNSQQNNYQQKNQSIANMMSYTLELTQAQNATFAGLKSVSTVVLNMMTNFNLVLFSSPFACFFLGFFNYFVLNSMYILLNIQLPNIIFQQLSGLYTSANMNLFTSFEIQLAPPTLSDQLVNEYRAFYFGISSDIFSSNYYSFGLVLVNILLFELILAVHRHIPKRHLFYCLLNFKREQIYFGFGVYLMVGIALPWKFAIFQPALNTSTKMNSACLIILLVCITFFLAYSLISFLDNQAKKWKNGKKDDKSKKQQQKCLQKTKKKQLSEWMIAYQNLIYPLLVLISNCMYFLIIILFSKIIELFVFMKHSTQRKLTKYIQIASFLCEIVYHCTFFIFATTKDQEIIIFNSLVCMGFFYLGAVFNLFWVLIYFINLIRKICISGKPRNKVQHHNSKSKKQDKVSSIQPVRLCQSWVPQADKTISFGKATNEAHVFVFKINKINNCRRNNKKVRTLLHHLKIRIV